MIDNLVLATTHGLLMLTAWRLIHMPALDDERAPDTDADADNPIRKRRWGKPRA